MGNEIIKGCRFLHIALYVSDFDRSLSFYGDGLGCELKATWGEPGRRTALMDFGNGTGIEIFEREVKKEKPDTACTGAYWHYALHTEDVDAAFKRAVSLGATVRNEPYEVNLKAVPETISAKMAFVFGPDGELIEFYNRKI